MIAHIVFFEPRADLIPEERRSFLAALQHAVTVIPQIKRAQIGRIVEFGQMPVFSGGHVTYSFGALFQFDSAEGLRTYLTHPAHDKVRELFWKFCASTLIADVALEDVAADVIEQLAK
jgi:hypothetical protein